MDMQLCISFVMCNRFGNGWSINCLLLARWIYWTLFRKSLFRYAAASPGLSKMPPYIVFFQIVEHTTGCNSERVAGT
jgi:hypothetical protein